MNIDDDDDLFNDFFNIVDQDDSQTLEQQIIENARDYTLIAIDCHPTLSLRNMPVKNKDDPTQKVNRAQLQQIIEAVVVYLRSQIISSPDSKYCIMFYNTNYQGASSQGLYQGEGIYILPHPNNDSPMHTLSRDYIRSLMDLENIVTFQQKIGITPYYEGTTEFHNVLSAVSQIYSGHAHAVNTERRVLLFTANEDPTIMPYLACRRRLYFDMMMKNPGTQAMQSVAFRGSQQPLKMIKTICENDKRQCLNRVTDNNALTWLLYPVQSSFPDLFEMNFKDRVHAFLQTQFGITIGPNGQPTNPKAAQQSIADSLNRSSLMNRTQNSTQDTMSLAGSQHSVSQSFQPSFQNAQNSHPASQFSASQNPSNSQFDQRSHQSGQSGQRSTNSRENVGGDEVVSLGLGGVVTGIGANQSDNSIQQQVSLATGSYSVDAFLDNFNLYQRDRVWIQQGLASQQSQQSIGPVAPSSSSPTSSTAVKVKDEVSNTDANQGSLVLRSQSTKTRSKLKFDPKFFEELFPDADIEGSIEQYNQQLQELKELKQVKSFKKRAITTVPLLFPTNPYRPGLPSLHTSYFLGLDVFPQFIETKIQASSDVKLSPVSQTPIHSKTLAVSKTSGEELNPSEIAHYFPLGSNEMVFFGKPEVAIVKDFGPGSLKILGFKEHFGEYRDLMAQLGVGNNVQRPYLCYPSELKYPGSSAAFGDFIQMLYSTKRYVLAQFIPKKRSVPRLVYLLPVLETTRVVDENLEQVSSTCLQLIFAPFYEDMRDVDSVNKVPDEIEDVPDTLMDAIHQTLDAFCQELAPPKYRELQLNDKFDLTTDLPSMYKLQLRQALLESLALGIPEHQHEDQLQLSQAMQHVDAVIEELYVAIKEAYPEIEAEFAKINKPKGTGTRGKAAGATGEDDGAGLAPTLGDDDAADAKVKKAAATKKRLAGNREQLEAAERAIAAADGMNDDDIAPAKPKGRGKKAAVSQDVDSDGEEPKKKAAPKRGKAAVKKEVNTDDEEEDEKPVKSARGRKPAAKKEINTDDDDQDDDKPVKSTRGRKPAAKKTVKEESDEEPKKKPAAKGRKPAASKKKKNDTESELDDGSSSDDDSFVPPPSSRPVRATRGVTRKFVVSSDSE